MSYSEFPHTNYQDTDFHELICLYKKLVADYDGTLQKITEVGNRLDEYQATMQPYINEQIDQRVSIAIDTFSLTIESDIAMLKKEIADLGYIFDIRQQELLNLITSNKMQTDNDIAELRDTDVTLLSQIGVLSSTVQINKEVTEQALANLDTALREVIRTTAVKSVAESKLYTAQQISALDNKLSAEIQAIAESSGSAAIKWLWQYGCCAHGFNAFQWYMLSEITAEDWSDMEFDCTDWYTNAKEVFWRFDSRNKMFSPISGKFVDIPTAIYELSAILNCNMIPAGIYDGLELTADEYDKTFTSAYDYDWSARDL